jgi:hypothetical protein
VPRNSPNQTECIAVFLAVALLQAASSAGSVQINPEFAELKHDALSGLLSPRA